MNNKFEENNLKMGSKKFKMKESMLQTTDSNETTNDKPQTTYSSLGSNPSNFIFWQSLISIN